MQAKKSHLGTAETHCTKTFSLFSYIRQLLSSSGIYMTRYADLHSVAEQSSEEI